MPRRRVSRESIDLWVASLPRWKREALRLLVEADRPLTTGEILDSLSEDVAVNTLYNWLSRLARRGLLVSVKVFMSNRRAWRLREEYKPLIARALGVQA